MVARMLRIAAALAAGLVFVSVFGMPSALAGGCRAGVTQGSGDTIEMVNACFTPTILHVDPGQRVTWINQDDFAHNITASGWGYFDSLDQGDVFRATFRKDGVYPFACTYHFGMSGAIVVGDGLGAGSGEFVSVESVGALEEEEEPAPVVAARSAPEGSSAIGWWIGGGIGLMIGVGLTLVARRPGSAAEARES